MSGKDNTLHIVVDPDVLMFANTWSIEKLERTIGRSQAHHAFPHYPHATRLYLVFTQLLCDVNIEGLQADLQHYAMQGPQRLHIRLTYYDPSNGAPCVVAFNPGARKLYLDITAITGDVIWRHIKHHGDPGPRIMEIMRLAPSQRRQPVFHHAPHISLDLHNMLEEGVRPTVPREVHDETRVTLHGNGWRLHYPLHPYAGPL